MAVSWIPDISFQTQFPSQHAAAIKRGRLDTAGLYQLQAAEPSKQDTSKKGTNKNRSMNLLCFFSLLCSVEQNVITEGKHPKAMTLQSFREKQQNRETEWEERCKTSVEKKHRTGDLTEVNRYNLSFSLFGIKQTDHPVLFDQGGQLGK